MIKCIDFSDARGAYLSKPRVYDSYTVWSYVGVGFSICNQFIEKNSICRNSLKFYNKIILGSHLYLFTIKNLSKHWTQLFFN